MVLTDPTNVLIITKCPLMLCGLINRILHGGKGGNLLPPS